MQLSSQMEKCALCCLVQFKIWKFIYTPGLYFTNSSSYKRKKAHTFFILLMGSWQVTISEEGLWSTVKGCQHRACRKCLWARQLCAHQGSRWQVAAVVKGCLLEMGPVLRPWMTQMLWSIDSMHHPRLLDWLIFKYGALILHINWGLKNLCVLLKGGAAFIQCIHNVGQIILALYH